jgi:hypothetical protein
MKATQKVRRIGKKEQAHIAGAAHAVRLGEAINHIEVAQHTGFHPVDAGRILAAYARMYNQATVDFYSEVGR